MSVFAGTAGVPGVPGVDGAAHVAVPARPPGVRAVPRAPRRLPRVPHRLLLRAQPRHGGRELLICFCNLFVLVCLSIIYYLRQKLSAVFGKKIYN